VRCDPAVRARDLLPWRSRLSVHMLGTRREDDQLFELIQYLSAPEPTAEDLPIDGVELVERSRSVDVLLDVRLLVASGR
jgi:hypothetical protein